jgi:predicted DCC family thiol-disulfide oxidoreductase YuxK
MNVVYFDGVCNLCDGIVTFLLDKDRHRKLTFASLQSEAGQEVLRRHGLSTTDYDSFLLLKEGTLYQKSDAALEVARLLGGSWRVLYILKWVPRSCRDTVYDLVARRRYRWFGRRATCRLPTPELRERFL